MLASARPTDTIFLTLMVAIAQLVERQIVVLDVAGSSPVSHPFEALFAHVVNKALIISHHFFQDPRKTLYLTAASPRPMQYRFRSVRINNRSPDMAGVDMTTSCI